MCIHIYIQFYLECIVHIHGLLGFGHIIHIIHIMCVLVTQVCSALCDPMDCSLPGSSGVGSQSLFQGIFPTQGLNPGLPALQADALPSEPPGKPIRIILDHIIGNFVRYTCSFNFTWPGRALIRFFKWLHIFFYWTVLVNFFFFFIYFY